MKKAFLLMLALLFATSCKQQHNERDADINLDRPVGIRHNEEYEVIDIDAVKEQWQAALKSEHYDEKLTVFTIIKGSTQGEKQDEYYILLAKNNEGTVKTAAMLNLKNDKFYFEQQQGTGSPVYIKILCAGECASGCDPVVNVIDNKRYLICTPCADCFKAEKEMR